MSCCFSNPSKKQSTKTWCHHFQSQAWGFSSVLTLHEYIVGFLISISLITYLTCFLDSPEKYPHLEVKTYLYLSWFINHRVYEVKLVINHLISKPIQPAAKVEDSVPNKTVGVKAILTSKSGKFCNTGLALKRSTLNICNAQFSYSQFFFFLQI